MEIITCQRNFAGGAVHVYFNRSNFFSNVGCFFIQFSYKRTNGYNESVHRIFYPASCSMNFCWNLIQQFAVSIDIQFVVWMYTCVLGEGRPSGCCNSFLIRTDPLESKFETKFRFCGYPWNGIFA